MQEFPIFEKQVKVGGTVVTIKDLSIAYLHKAQTQDGFDGPRNALLDATDLPPERIDALGVKTATALYDEILKHTFGDDDKDADGADGKK